MYIRLNQLGKTAVFVRGLAAVMRDRREVEWSRLERLPGRNYSKCGVSMVLAKSRAQVLHRRVGAEQEDGRP